MDCGIDSVAEQAIDLEHVTTRYSVSSGPIAGKCKPHHLLAELCQQEVDFDLDGLNRPSTIFMRKDREFRTK